MILAVALGLIIGLWKYIGPIVKSNREKVTKYLDDGYRLISPTTTSIEESTFPEKRENFNFTTKTEPPKPKNPIPSPYKVPESRELISSISHQKQPFLENATSISLLNILKDIQDVMNKSFDNHQHSVHKSQDPDSLLAEYQDAVLYDLSQIALLLEIGRDDKDTDSRIIVCAYGFFLLKKEDVDSLLDKGENFQMVSRKLQLIRKPKFTSEIGHHVNGIVYFKGYKVEYLSHLIELLTLIISCDLITKKEERIRKHYLDLRNQLLR
ncbi:MAG: hypothetical protein EON98_00255 [Chitinophagaceae bacterium]|nr:MAG: hypothetical protein EON98_00255 [Chitinophagaceae bacterium]